MIVYLAASFIRYYAGEKLILMNKGQTAVDHKADLIIRASIDEAFEKAMNLLGNK